MFYKIKAWNQTSWIIWSENPKSLERYLDSLNLDRETNLYDAYELGETGFEAECAMSLDEPHWDDFMHVFD